MNDTIRLDPSDNVETALRANPHYAHALRMGQLAPLAVEAVERLDRLFGDADARLAMVKPRAILRNQQAK